VAPGHCWAHLFRGSRGPEALPQRGAQLSLSPFFPHRCALPPTPPPRPPTSLMPSPCSRGSRLLRASMVAAAEAQWPRQPLRPRHTSPMPPPGASQHPAGQLQPRPQEAHSTNSRSRPCGLRHPLPQLQTGHPWPPNRPPQNRGPILPWRQRDKGGPSPLPEARSPWGGGEDISAGPFTPLSAPLCPGALEGRLDLARQGSVLCQHAQLHARSRPHGLGSEWLGCLEDSTSETRQPSREDLPAPPHPFQGCLGASPGGDVAGSWRGASWGQQT
jgi:hypothetical protein